MADTGTQGTLAPIGWAVPVIAAFLASAGLPLYIHLPSYAAEIGISLGAIGILLLVLRIVDFVQDPALGLLVDRFPQWRRQMALLAFFGMGAGFFIVFTLRPDLPALFAALVAIFTAYSLGTILFYGQGAELAGREGTSRHLKLAGIREMGALAGIVVAAILPGAFAAVYGALAGYAAFGIVLAVAAAVVGLSTRQFWKPIRVARPPRQTLRTLLHPEVRKLLAIALVNALPVAVTSTLFLFFVGDRLQLPQYAGLYLVLFFLSAGLSAPIWSRLAARHGARRTLLPTMAMAITAFIGASLLAPGSAVAFGVISIASGAALGADMVVLPALFASTLMRRNIPTGAAFGVWAFAAKLSLALAAAVVLPILQATGYEPAQANTPEALRALNTSYAILPCGLKVLAMILVARLEE